MHDTQIAPFPSSTPSPNSHISLSVNSSITMESQAERITTSSMAEQADSSSAEEVDSPKSVVSAARRSGGRRLRRWRNKKDDHMHSKRYLHNQVLRIKEEELKISENLIDYYYYYYDFGSNNKNNNNYVESSEPLDDRVVMWAREILPASPLSGKNNHRSCS